MFEDWKISIELCSFLTQINKKTLSRYFIKNFKEIENEVYTILSNPDLWAKWLVWIIPWIKAKDIEEFISNNSTQEERNIVKEISMDMANTMKHIATWVFPNTVQVVDRFHVMKNVLEDMSALISKVKTEVKKDYLEE